jgi:2-dehydro-3-deoxyphosphogluconate aldolase/(4S)-4-hydroxy-2-oxoglutarate aldolase
MNEVLSKLSLIGIIPVVKIEDAEKAVPLAAALTKGGLPCAEITFRTAQAEEAIKRITSTMPDMLVGAGTVLTIEQVNRAVNAGAKFIVSPGLNPAVVKYCIEHGITIVPGCSNPTDIEAAMELGLDTVKFFPAEAMGGIKVIRALAAPYGRIKFIPTGGVNEKNINDYLSCPSVVACGGSWMVNEALIKAGDFEKITALTRESIKTVMGFEMAHIGINTENESEAEATAHLLSNAFGFEYKTGNNSIFSGKSFEVMKKPGRGRNGHIAIATNSVERAVAYMDNIGFKMDMDNGIRDINGMLKAVYFNQEFAGFAVHLVRK